MRSNYKFGMNSTSNYISTNYRTTLATFSIMTYLPLDYIQAEKHLPLYQLLTSHMTYRNYMTSSNWQVGHNSTMDD